MWIQIVTQDVSEVFVHGRIVHRTSDLNPTVTPFKSQTPDIEVEKPNDTKDKINAKKIKQPAQ